MTLKWSSATDQLYAVSNSSPSLDLDFASNKSLLDNISGFPLVNHQRDASSGKSAGTYVGSDGLIKTSAVNLLTYSEQFDQSAWIKTNALQVTADQSTAPDGLTTADLLTRTGNQQIVYQVVNAGDYVFSVFAKSNTSSKITLASTTSFAGSCVVFDLSTGTAGSVIDYINGSSSTITLSSPSIQNVGNGWYRCSVVAALTASRALHAEPGDLTDTAASAYIWGAQVEEGSTATTYVPTTNLQSGAPRFDFHPVTGESLGLLIEESRTNYFTNSTPTSTWAQYNGSSITDNQATGPNGVTNSASLVTFPATGGAIPIIGAPSTGVSGTATVSMYVRAVTGTVSLQIGTNTAYGTTQIVGTSWTRIQFTTASLGTSAGLRSGDVNSVQNFYVFGGQIEAGVFPTSYIPTSGSTVTRAADVASITGTNFSSWYASAPQTWFVEYDTPYVAANVHNPTLLNLNSAAFTDGPAVRVQDADRILYWDNPVPTTFINSAFVVSALSGRYALSLDSPSGSLTQACNGEASPATFTAKPFTSVTQMYLGDASGASTFKSLNGHISRFTYYPYRLSDTILQEITS